MWDKIAETLASQGLSGIAILVEGGVIWYLIGWIRDLIKQQNELQEKRVAEREAVVQAISNSTDAMVDVTKATEANNRALENMSRSYPPRGVSA